MTVQINTNHRAVVAVREHIRSNKALASACVAIRIDEPSDCRVVVSALEIIEAGFVIVIVAAIAKGVEICKGGAGGLFVDEVIAAAVEDAGQFSPRVVGVGGVGFLCVAGDVAVGILDRNGAENLHHVALLVQRVEVVGVGCAVVFGELEAKGAALGVVGEHHDFGRSAFSDFLPNDLAVQRPVLMQRAVYNLTGTNSVGIVGVFARLAARRDLRKLAAVLPRQAAVAL